MIEEKNVEKYSLNQGDVLIARTGGTIGKSFLIRDLSSGIPILFASYLIRVKLIDGINREYLMYYLRSPLYWEQLREMSAGTGQPNVNAQNLKKLLIPIPPIEEQNRIDKKINHLLTLRNNIENIY